MTHQHPQSCPTLWLQVTYYCWKILRYFQRTFFLSVLPRLHFPGSSFCVIIGEQLEFQFINSSNTSRSRFVTVFCPCTTHFSERPAANDSFESNFDFALPHVFRSVKICLSYVDTSDQFEVIDSHWTFCCVLTVCL